MWTSLEVFQDLGMSDETIIAFFRRHKVSLTGSDIQSFSAQVATLMADC
jgi:hypothetical protein